MIGTKTKYIVYALVLGGIIWMLKDSFSQPGVADLNGSFKERAFYRNENNTGPIVRIYAVSLNDTLWKEMEAYGNLMPHNKYGTTRVFYFSEKKQFPDILSETSPHFDPKFNKYCLGVYEKNGMGEISLIKFPFNN